jgi:hypothetical protein
VASTQYKDSKAGATCEISPFNAALGEALMSKDRARHRLVQEISRRLELAGLAHEVRQFRNRS